MRPVTKAEHIENALVQLFDSRPSTELTRAMKYSLLGGGKRLRGILVLEFAEMLGGAGAQTAALPLACAIEAVHAHSLVHDDLPCMDNDSVRRGKPSCHVAFGEATALLAGDALMNMAYSIVASDEKLTDKQRCDAVKILSDATGESGMLGGQEEDKLCENSAATEHMLDSIQIKKTGALIRAACLLGCVAANASENDFIAASDYAISLGRAFQITDDILDIMSTTETLGKPVGSDAANRKITYVSTLGMKGAYNKAVELTCVARSCLAVYGSRATSLNKLAEQMLKRVN